MALTVTDEMRAAVHAEDCAARGHDIDINNAFSSDGSAEGQLDVRGHAGQIAHLACRRCGQVWLITEDPGTSYDDAVAKEKARVKDPDSVKPKPRADPKPAKGPKGT